MSHLHPCGILIHSMGEFVLSEYGKLSAYEYLTTLKLSVHKLIKPNGNQISMTPSYQLARHAGNSKFGKLEGLNKYFLGVELLVAGCHDQCTLKQKISEKDCYSDEQYFSLAKLCQQWMQDFNIPQDHIAGHDNVAGDDIRGTGLGKFDPGKSFDWEKFRNLIKIYNQI